MPGAAFCLMLTTDYVWAKWYANRLKPYTIESKQPGILVKRTVRGPAFSDALAPLPCELVKKLRQKKRVDFESLLDWPFINGVANIRAEKHGRYWTLLINGIDNTETLYMNCKDWDVLVKVLQNVAGFRLAREIVMVTGNTVFIDLVAEGFDPEYLEALNHAMMSIGDLAQMSFDKGIGGEVIMRLLEAHAALDSIYPLVKSFLKTE